MEEIKKKSMSTDMNEKDIVFSKSVKAGKRIYYLDVKKNRKDEMFLAITESKKIVSGEGDDSAVSFEKHKIFLYREDFRKFMTMLEQAIGFVEQHQGCTEREVRGEFCSNNELIESEIKIDIDFE